MFGSMRNFLDKYQKHLLVVLAAFLMVVFVIPMGVFTERGQPQIEGRIFGRDVTRAGIDDFRSRWLRLGLNFVRTDMETQEGEHIFNTYLLVRAAREEGVRASSDAVNRMMRQRPRYNQRIEYVLADPDDLADDIELDADEVRQFHRTESEHRDEPFEDVEAAVRDEYRALQTRRLAAQLAREAHQQIEAIPEPAREGDRWRRALATAAESTDPPLTYQLSGSFNEQNAADVLDRLTLPAPDATLPDAVAELLFRIPVGQVSPLFQAGDKHYFFRVTEVSAGMTAQGTLFNRDYGWRHGQYVLLREYADYDELFEAKIGLSTSRARLTFEEYLQVQEYVRLMAGTDETTPLSSDTAEQATRMSTEEASALVLEFGVRPFYDLAAPPSPEELLTFYDERKRHEPTMFSFGYLQPASVRIQYARGTEAQRTDLRRLTRETRDAAASPAGFESRATELGLEFGTSDRLMSAEQLRRQFPDMAQAEAFPDMAFQDMMWPPLSPAPGMPAPETGQISPILSANGELFIFRVLDREDARAVEFDRLPPQDQQRVQMEHARFRAVQKAKDAASDLKRRIAGDLLARLAQENGLDIQTDTIIGGHAPDLPDALADYVDRRLTHAPGEIVPLVEHDGVRYTAVTVRVDEIADEIHIEYVAFSPDDIAAVEPDDEFDGPYREYLREALVDIFRTTAAELQLPARARTTDPFRDDDPDALLGDETLARAAFQLEPNTVSPPIVGEEYVVIMVREPSEAVEERKLEWMSVDPESYRPLTVTVDEDEARAFYQEHRDTFREPTRSRAEFILATFDRVQSQIMETITDEEIEDYYQADLESEAPQYEDRELDNRLRQAIRRELARTRAREEAAEQTVRLARQAALEADETELTAIARELPDEHRQRIIADVTERITDDDVMVHPYLYSPEIAALIVESPVNELSDPIEVPGQGWVVFRVVERTDAFVPEFEDIEAEVVRAARADKLADRARRAVETVWAEVTAQPELSIAQALQRPELTDELPPRVELHPPAYTSYAEAEASPDISLALRQAAFTVEPGRVTDIVESHGQFQFARVIEAREHELAKVHYIPFPADLYAAMIEIEEDEARQHYEEHKADYMTDLVYELETLTFAEDELDEAELEPTEDELEQAYRQLRARFKDEDASEPGRPVYKPLTDDSVREEVGRIAREEKTRARAGELLRAAYEMLRADEPAELGDIADELPGVELSTHVEYLPDAPAEASTFPWLHDLPGLGSFLEAAEVGDTSPLLRSLTGRWAIARLARVHDPEVPDFEEVRYDIELDLERRKQLAWVEAFARTIADRVEEPTAEGLTNALPDRQAFRQIIGEVYLDHVPPTTRADLMHHQHQLSWQMQWLDQMPPEQRQWMEFQLLHGAAGLVRMEQMFNLRYLEISEPIVIGDKAMNCAIQILTELEQPEVDPEMAAQLADSYRRQAYRERLAALIRSVVDQYEPVRRPQLQ